MTLNKHLTDLINDAVELEDQTERDTGGSGDFEYTPPAAGVTVGRLIEYVELGDQPQKPYQGKDKPPAPEVRLVFELLAPKNIKEIDGKKYADRIVVKIKKSLNTKATFVKLFDKIRYGRPEIKHIAQALGEAFILTVVHSEYEKNGKKQVSAGIRNETGEYLIAAPFSVDPITEERKDIPVPPQLSDLKLFLFDKPTKLTWDSLFIDGERVIKDDKGNETAVSKNWLQEKIISATNFEGSALEAMFEGSASLPENPADLSDEAEEEVVEEKPAPAKKSVKDVGKKKPAPATSTAKATASKETATAPATTVSNPSKAPTTSAEAALAALGL